MVLHWLLSWLLHKQETSYLMQWESWQWHPQDQQYDFKVIYLLMSSWIYSESSCLGMLKDNVHSSICSRTSIHLLSIVWNLYTLLTGFLNTERDREEDTGRKERCIDLMQQKIHHVLIKDDPNFLNFYKGRREDLNNFDNWQPQGPTDRSSSKVTWGMKHKLNSIINNCVCHR